MTDTLSRVETINSPTVIDLKEIAKLQNKNEINRPQKEPPPNLAQYKTKKLL